MWAIGRIRRETIVMVIALALAAGGSAANEAVTDTVATLDQAIRLAEARNPGLQAVFDRWTAKRESVARAARLPDPQFTYGYFVDPVETRVGPQRQRFGISQRIPLSGRLGLSKETALRGADAAGAQFAAAGRWLRLRLTRLWHELGYLDHAVEVTERNRRLLAELEELLLTRYAAGMATHAEVVRTQIELAQLTDRLRTLGDRRGPLVAELNAELDRPAAAPVGRPGAPQDPLPLSSLPELRENLLAHNPELAAQRFVVARETAAEKLAGRSAVPDLTLGLDYIDIDEARFAGVADSGKDAVMATAGIALPLWSGGRGAERAEAAALRSAAQRDYDRLVNALTAELERAYFEFTDADRKVQLYTAELLPDARRSWQVTESAFIAGEADLADLIDSRRLVLEFELALQRALADRAIGRAHLDMLAGPDPVKEE